MPKKNGYFREPQEPFAGVQQPIIDDGKQQMSAVSRSNQNRFVIGRNDLFSYSPEAKSDLNMRNKTPEVQRLYPHPPKVSNEKGRHDAHFICIP